MVLVGIGVLCRALQRLDSLGADLVVLLRTQGTIHQKRHRVTAASQTHPLVSRCVQWLNTPTSGGVWTMFICHLLHNLEQGWPSRGLGAAGWPSFLRKLFLITVIKAQHRTETQKTCCRYCDLHWGPDSPHPPRTHSGHQMPFSAPLSLPSQLPSSQLSSVSSAH